MTTRRQNQIDRECWTGQRTADLNPDQLAAAKLAGYEPGPDQHIVGRDPRTMSPDQLIAMGRQRMSASLTIRTFCLDCCGGSPHEVRLCPATTCPNWDRRMGSDPWRTPASETKRQASRERMLKLRAARTNPVNHTEPNTQTSKTPTAVAKP
jgi:hypothetical protein